MNPMVFDEFQQAFSINSLLERYNLTESTQRIRNHQGIVVVMTLGSVNGVQKRSALTMCGSGKTPSKPQSLGRFRLLVTHSLHVVCMSSIFCLNSV